ncbi:MAG TPA: GtrA family protein [Opitutaceae bacterium]|nr:GtrA family protein [Opitutaceae bacterium]
MFKRFLPARETRGRFLRFVVVGGTAFGVQMSTLALGKRMLPPDAAFTVSFLLATATHYSLNRFWALPSARRDTMQQLGEYLATAGASYLINLGLFRLALSVIGLSVMGSALVAVPPSTLVVFLLLNYRVFRHRHAQTNG